MISLRHTLCYLSVTVEHVILYQDTPYEPLCSFSDANYAAAFYRDSTRHVHMSLCAPVSWMSGKMVTIALSSFEAEYLAASLSLQGFLRLKPNISNIHPRSIDSPTPLHIDNMSTVLVAWNQARTKRRKHYYISAHHLGHHIRTRTIRLHHIPTWQKSLGPDYVESGETDFSTSYSEVDQTTPQQQSHAGAPGRVKS